MKKIIIAGLLLGAFFVAKCQGIEQARLSQVDGGQADLVQLSLEGPLQLTEPRVNSDEIGLYEKFEITFDLTGEWDNPFDPDQIKVDAHFYSPDGEEIVVPGFFYQEYHQREDGDLEKVGAPVWKVRFTPVQTGEYRYQVGVNNKGEKIQSPADVFTSVPYNANHGFVRIPTAVGTNPLYFEYSDGTPFFGVAMGEAGGSPSYFEMRYKRFAKAGGNFNRLFLTGGSLNIAELNPTPERPDRGLGKMNLENSWNLDQVLESGERLGIYHMLTLTNQWTFHNRWEVHSYNKENGGILDSASDYWTNEEAMQYFEKQLRYHVARWGYSTSVFSWDLWNEYTAAPGSELATAIPWHQRMARYISSVDAFDHVIHTNDGSLNGRDQMHELPEIEIVSTNTYAVKNIAKVAETWTKRHVNQFNKPYVLSEVGPGHSTGGIGYGGMDPERRMVHNGLWGPLVSGGATTGLAWDSNWLDHHTFYTYTRAVSKFVDGVPFSKRRWEPVSVSSFAFSATQTSPYYADVLVEGWPGNFRRSPNPPEFFQIDENGNVDQQESLSAILSGGGGRRPSSVGFTVEYPVGGEFTIYVTELRDTEPTSQLTVILNGEQVLEKDLPPLDVENFNPVMYNQTFTIDIPKGFHNIRIENTGGGSFVTAFELKNYLLKNGPDLEVRGLQSEDYILVWLKNPKFTILHSLVNEGIESQPAGLLELQNVPDAIWEAEWINTVDATLVKTEIVKSSNQILVLETPVVEQSVAVRLRKIN